MLPKLIGRVALVLAAVALILLMAVLIPEKDASPVLLAVLWAVVIPIWIVWVVLSKKPTPSAVASVRKPKPPRCRSCGYDLRATPYRCPECGQAADPLVDSHLIDPELTDATMLRDSNKS